MDYLDEVEDEITRPDTQRHDNPTEARPGDTFDGGILVKKRLGRGASSVAFVVQHQGQERVLKLAADVEHNQRLRTEGETLHKLRHQSIIAYHQTQTFLGHTGLIVDYAAEGTLDRRLRKQGAIQLELLDRFGDDLLGALCHLEEKGISHRDIKPENIGLMKQGRHLHLVLFDFSLSNISVDNFTAGTVAYMDPFIRDPGRRRWDDYAEGFATALTLYEMATGTLPAWAAGEGMPSLIEGSLEIDSVIFDPGVRDAMAGFFRNALAREVKQRFGNAEDMRRAWRKIFLQAQQETTQHPRKTTETQKCPVSEAQLDTQIGLLPLSAQALDTLSRLNINSVDELMRLPRNELVRMTGVGTQTRRELSQLIAQLQARLGGPFPAVPQVKGDVPLLSVDQLFRSILPNVTKATDQARHRFMNEYLGRLDSDAPKGGHNVHWPTLVNLGAEIGMESADARDIQARVLAQWGKNKFITQLRNDITSLIGDQGGLMTAMELADYAEALGQLADECAEQQPLLSPLRALERIRAVAAPDSFAGLSNHRLMRLAVAASQGAALSSRAEFYARGLPAERSIELGQGALLGTHALAVAEVHARIHGRYPEAQPLPGRPQLDALMQKLELGFAWDGHFERGGKHGAYCLPQAGLTSYASPTHASFHYTKHEQGDASSAREIEQFSQTVQNTIDSPRFLALSARPSQWHKAKERLSEAFSFQTISFDELLLRHLHRLCDAMANPPNWQVVLQADATDTSSVDWSRLQGLVRRALPAMADEVKAANRPVLLTEPGLLARYELVNSWLSDLRQRLMNGQPVQALVLLIANDIATAGAIIDGTSVPSGAGSKEFARVPSAWIELARAKSRSWEGEKEGAHAKARRREEENKEVQGKVRRK